MTRPTPTTRVVRSLDVPLGGNRTLRVSLAEASGDMPEALVLAAGFGGAEGGTPFHRPHWAGDPLQLPGEALGPLREALAPNHPPTPPRSLRGSLWRAPGGDARESRIASQSCRQNLRSGSGLPHE